MADEIKEAGSSTSSKTSGWVRLGFAFTGAYFVLVALAWITSGPTSLVDIKPGMKLNEFADGLAGLFAPLAFLWLFVATMVQSQELALQRQELQLTRREFEQNREVAKEQAAEARNQAAYIRTQTEIIVRADADRHLNALIDGFREFLSTYLMKPMAASDGQKSTHILALGAHPGSSLGELIAHFSNTADAVGANLKKYPDRKLHADWVALDMLRNMLNEINVLIPETSPTQKAILESAEFDTLIDAVAYLADTAKPQRTGGG
ncbi:hypothetical protein EN780_24390 [Mesorhizobium sp. M4B.F.Ca.ET.089.01.1.1]|uniref:hypothetical protein n=1 Tax=Mesorhizobium sp. M4B.F.Ca.ET.089.01.1.1 TaxID=2496662 RepID=UPI000FE3C246|nr:hypothetical protein [Mesorhizobium sp. M4B.F.Ca.ET.089.01.1.1]RWX63206.1 hypothetical protein EN780_24390 [Mesorhizobium sp. M4B.F.Ca.ET.089.01.1.1]